MSGARHVASMCVLVVGAVLLSGRAGAGDDYDGVEYVAGKAGFEKKIKGRLTIDEHGVRFDDQKGRAIFSIPAVGIDGAKAGAEREEGSFGRKMALGIFASKTQEYLQVESHDATGAEAVVFRVRKKTGAGMAAKIHFWADKARAKEAPEDAPTGPPPAPVERRP